MVGLGLGIELRFGLGLGLGLAFGLMLGLRSNAQLPDAQCIWSNAHIDQIRLTLWPGRAGF